MFRIANDAAAYAPRALSALALQYLVLRSSHCCMGTVCARVCVCACSRVCACYRYAPVATYLAENTYQTLKADPFGLMPPEYADE